MENSETIKLLKINVHAKQLSIIRSLLPKMFWSLFTTLYFESYMFILDILSQG